MQAQHMPLHVAVLAEQDSVVIILIRHGANPFHIYLDRVFVLNIDFYCILSLTAILVHSYHIPRALNLLLTMW